MGGGILLFNAAFIAFIAFIAFAIRGAHCGRREGADTSSQLQGGAQAALVREFAGTPKICF